MNKIYKVIWSKVRNCYVAVGEIAKRNGKSCTSVNCGAKANRRRVALALSLALCVTGGVFVSPQAAMAADQPVVSTTTINENKSDDDYMIDAENIVFTVGTKGKVKTIRPGSSHNNNTIIINSGGEVTGSRGTFGLSLSIEGGTDNNSITTSGTIAGTIAGGLTAQSNEKGNSVTVNGGIINGDIYGTYALGFAEYGKGSVSLNSGTVKGDIFGAYAENWYVLNSSVTIAGGTAEKNVYGGYVGGVGEADATNNTVTITGGAVNCEVYGGYAKGKSIAGGDTEQKGNRVTISGGTVTGSVYGGYSYEGSGARYNQVTVNGNGSTNAVYGGYGYYGSGNIEDNIVTINTNGTVGTIIGGSTSTKNVTVQNNKVNIKKGTISGRITGGTSTTGSTVSGNRVIISGGTISGTNGIEGGHSTGASGSATYNTVTIAGGNFNSASSNIYGGNVQSGTGPNTSYNIVNLYGSVTGLNNANLYGSNIFDNNSKGNELHIGGTKTYTKQNDSYVSSETVETPFVGNTGTTQTNTVISVNNFQSIVLHKVNWNPNMPVLAAGGFSNIGKLDISGMTFTGTNAEIGSMKLLASDTNNDFSSLSLTYNKISDSATLDGAALNGTATLNSTHPSQIVKVNDSSDPGAEISSDSNKVRFWYRPNLHRVSLDSANNYKNVIYSIADEVRSIMFLSGIGWSITPNIVAGSKYDFSNIVSVDASSLSFNFTNDQAGELSKNSTMTLVSNATGLPSTISVTYKNSASNHTQSSIPYNITNVASLSGTLTGKVERAYNDDLKKPFLRYSASSMTLDTVNLGSTDYKWDGSTTTGTVPAGWTANPNGISVTTAGLTVPTDIEAGTSRDILTTNGTANYFQSVQFDSGSTNNNVYKSHSFSDESSSGSDITFTGTQYKGVKVGSTSTDIANDKLIYAVDKKNVSTITLGGMSWETGRTPGSDDYNFSTVTGVDASGLTFTFTDTQAGELQAGSNMTLLSGATGLPVGVEPSYGGEKTSHSQSVPYSAANSVTLTGTLTGTVATEAEAEAGVGKVTYTATGVKLNSIDLAGWNSSIEAPFVPEGWENNLGNDSITAAGFTEPTLAAGESRVILQAATNDYFNDDQITGSKKNTTSAFVNDKVKEVTFSGNHLSGGVKAEANGTKLTYYAEAMDVSNIKLGNVAWNDGRSAGNLYAFNNVTAVDATDLLITFANESDKGSLSNTSTTTLVSNATGLPDSVAVNYKNSASNHTQEISYNITNGVSMTGTLTGTIASGTVSEKKALVYSVAGMTLDSINLAGWESSIAATAVPAGWTNQLGNNSITAEGFDEPALALGQSLDILTATTEGYFNDDQITGGKKYSTSSLANDTVNGVTLSGTHYGGVKAEDNGKKLTYYAETMDVTGIALGSMKWGTTTGRTSSGLYFFNNVSSVNASGLSFTNPDEVSGSMELLSGATDLAANKMVTGADHSQSFDKAMTNGVSLSSTLKGTVSTTASVVKYTATGTTVNSVNLAGWDGTAASSVPDGWALAAGATIETDGMSLPMVEAGKHVDILQSDTDGFFANVPINGANAYGKTQYTFTESDAAKSVTIAGTQDKGVTLNTENKHLIYKAGTMDVNSVTLGPVEWKKGATVFDRSSTGYNYAGVAALGTDGFAVSYASPETVATGDSMTLLQANATLKDMAEQLKQTSYSFAPVSGVTIDATVTGSLEAKGGNVTYTATANQASKLTFTNVDWKDSGALMTRPSNITFAGADVDTTKIHFKNVKELDANKKMTLVSDFGDSVGTITGTKYTVGAGLEGEGAASLSGSDLVFTTKTGARDLAAQEQTHNTLMVMEAGMAVLAAGNEYVGQTMAELANPQNVSLDGTVTAASLGGGKSRYKTGSHVDSNNWNVAVAVGSKRELKKGSLEWGVFGEYGKSNYTLHSDAGRGDGDSHYAGGGLMAKWTNKHDVYTEASVRLGRLNDTASNLLRDAAGNGYGYDVHANYFGAHVGIGKIIHYKGGKSLDVYGKYFYTKRDGVDFTSGGNNYSLDSVASSVLRVGARYGTTDKKWNWYGGLAYEYEFDGKSEGTVDGVGIRAASVKGGSVRGEIGLRMSATKTNPWQTDISIYGYGGKHRGFGGSVNVAYMF